MERALASAIASASAMIEAHMRAAQRRARALAEHIPDVPEAYEQRDIQDAARGELAVAQHDANYWRQASVGEIADRIRSEYGVDPARVGERDADRHWAQRAGGGDVLGVYETARRWSPQSEVAERQRANIDELFNEWGLDGDTLVTMDREAAAERITLGRAAFYAERGEAQPTGPASTVDTERSAGRDVDDRGSRRDVGALALVASADAVDRIDRSDRARAIAGSGPGARAQAIADQGTNSDAVRGASIAARDFPVDPAEAIKSENQSKAPKARSGGRSGPEVERGRGM